MTPKILVVDDEDLVLQATTHVLQSIGYEVRSTSDTRHALTIFTEFKPDVCVLDYHMPQMLGSDLAKMFKERDPLAEILFLTGEGETSVVIDVMKKGALDYMIKPVDRARLHSSIERALDHRRLVKENLDYQEHLEDMVRVKTESLHDSLLKLEHLSAATLHALGIAMDYRDQSTSGHSKRVAYRTVKIAKEIGITGDTLVSIEQGAFLHDIGKLRVPDRILLKPGKLTTDEWTVMREHPQYGRDFLKEIDFLRGACELVFTHHEKFDGSGYPQGLKGFAIPIGARIFAVVDAIDAMTYPRPYNRVVSLEEALAEIQRCRGSHFDPDVADVAIRQAAN
jgi:response regulator RpfG family c-di-GMP phosphodiesterase